MWDLFISHASEDKEAVARPLTVELQRRGYKVWLDESELRIGDSLRRSIDQGLAGCRFGVVILSRNFFAKQWPQRELDGLTSREIRGDKVILPVWHNITWEDVVAYSPVLADRLAIDSGAGISALADAIAKATTGSVASHQPVAPHSFRRLSSNATSVLRYTLEQALTEVGHTPEVDDVMQSLGLAADDYAEAVEELQSLDLVSIHGNGNHASGYARAVLKAVALIEYRHLVPAINIQADLGALLRIIVSKGRGRQLWEEIADELSIPLPRLQLFFDFLEETQLVELKGSGSTDGLLFSWVEFTPTGRRVAQGLDVIPVLGIPVSQDNGTALGSSA